MQTRIAEAVLTARKSKFSIVNGGDQFKRVGKRPFHKCKGAIQRSAERGYRSMLITQNDFSVVLHPLIELPRYRNKLLDFGAGGAEQIQPIYTLIEDRRNIQSLNADRAIIRPCSFNFPLHFKKFWNESKGQTASFQFTFLVLAFPLCFSQIVRLAKLPHTDRDGEKDSPHRPKRLHPGGRPPARLLRFRRRRRRENDQRREYRASRNEHFHGQSLRRRGGAAQEAGHGSGQGLSDGRNLMISATFSKRVRAMASRLVTEN